ncbi:MAG TPA: hypothetical protein VHW23_30595 [Kofleriaceae bacterium]|jgi:hypothetical protein|nr:hypothetical protein [Kofleriaceae bacterium]
MTAVRFQPLAITRADDREGCVGAVTSEGQWFRPQPVTADDVDPDRGIYRYGRWYEADVVPAFDADARPEDHQLVGPVRELAGGAALAWPALVRPSIADALDDDRSLGLVRARIVQLYARRSLGKKTFLRAVFCDDTGERYDWIVPEVAFGQLAWPHVADTVLAPGWAADLVGFLARAQTYVTVGLTRPNGRFPGKFRGCHPLVVGLHSAPDYRPVFAEVRP